MRGRTDRHGHEIYGRDGVALPTAAQAAAIDTDARERVGVPGRVLMESAGRSAAQLIHAFRPEGRIVAVAGPGNNGGDAVVALRSLRAWGRDVALVQGSGRLPDDALRHDHTIPALEGEAARAAVMHADVVIDGMLGTGASGAPRGEVAGWIATINRSGGFIVALDLPSGIDATTGQVPAEAVRAALTITFGAPKLGMMLNPARTYCGRIIAVEIGFPPQSPAGAELITPAWAATRLPRRSPDAHKNSAGRVLVLAGSSGMAGAAVLCAKSAQRAGAGHVRIASVMLNRAILQTSVPQSTFIDSAHLADADIGTVDALVAGPGLGTSDDARAALQHALTRTTGAATLLDADALNLLGREEGALRALAAERPLLLTPHPGEMARLLGAETAEITRDPVGAVREAASRFRAVVLLKGQPSMVAAEGAPLLVASGGSSDLASAGMGDHLAGVAGAFLAAGADPRTAAGLALHYSSRAALLAKKGRSLGPEDAIEMLPRAFASPGRLRPPVAFPFITFDQPARW